MRSLRNPIARLIGLLIAAALAAGVAALSWPQLAVTRQTLSNRPVGELVAGRRLGQTFRAPFSGLYRVDVFLAAYARQNRGPVLFHLTEGVGGAEIATIEIDAAQVEDNAYHAFTFDPVPDSAGRTFYFYLESPQAAPGNAIAIWSTDFDSYPDGQAYKDDQPTGQDLRFSAGYRATPQEVWRAFSERVRAWHPLLWQARWLVLGAALILILGIGLLLGELLVGVFGT